MNHKFRDNIKKLRKEHNLSQEQLAEELGVSRQAISKWESGVAYPEMDKILFLCEKFNLNIDDLLNKDIQEVKGEEETKKKLNKYVEDFFKFITDTINLFCNMKLKSKIKCLFEQAVIAAILIIIFAIVYAITGNIIHSIFYSILPKTFYYAIYSFIEGLYMLVAFLLAIIIMARVFKTRYLDYYEQLLGSNEKENSQESKEKNQKVELKQTEEKIIIRDPKHSEYRFFNAIYKLIIIGIKLCALWVALFLCIGLFSIAVGIVLSFLVAKTGILFIGLLLSLIMAGIMLFVVILLIFNFIFNRKSDKKNIIWTFTLSIVLLGIGCGLIFVGTLSFDITRDEQPRKTEITEIKMTDNTFLDYDEIEYIVEDRENIKIEYQIRKNNKVEIYENEDGLVHMIVYNDNQLEEIRYILNEFNKKNIVELDYNISNIKVYASKENIDKMKKNQEIYHDDAIRFQEIINEYEEELRLKEETIEDFKEQIEILEEKIDQKIEE